LALARFVRWFFGRLVGWRFFGRQQRWLGQLGWLGLVGRLGIFGLGLLGRFLRQLGFVGRRQQRRSSSRLGLVGQLGFVGRFFRWFLGRKLGWLVGW
jgi:hypothetical protein